MTLPMTMIENNAITFWSCNRATINIFIRVSKHKLAARPSMPSMKLKAFVTKTTAKNVIKYPSQALKAYTPKRPCKLLIHVPEAHKITADNICPMNLVRYLIPVKSSVTPKANKKEDPTNPQRIAEISSLFSSFIKRFPPQK